MKTPPRCVQCEKELPLDAVFCAFCGAKQPLAKPASGDEHRASTGIAAIAPAVSESFVWDANVLADVRDLLSNRPQDGHSQEQIPLSLREWIEASRYLDGHSLVDAETTAQAPSLLPPRTMLMENYVIEDVVGIGGMGVVYRAKDLAMHRRVAVKVLHANLFRKDRSRQRFMREAHVMATLYHPNIVSIYELIDQDDLLAIVMPFVPGTQLKSFLEQQTQPIDLNVIGKIMFPVLDGVEYAHQRGIIHRDLKPDNILLAKLPATSATSPEFSYIPMLTDFGLAKVMEGTNYTMSGALLGTCMYMAPEQFQSQRTIDHKADIYALGVILYQLCTGRSPFTQTNLFSLMTAHLQEAPPDPMLFRSDLPQTLATLILEALHKVPEQRIDSCLTFRHRLQQILHL